MTRFGTLLFMVVATTIVGLITTLGATAIMATLMDITGITAIIIGIMATTVYTTGKMCLIAQAEEAVILAAITVV